MKLIDIKWKNKRNQNLLFSILFLYACFQEKQNKQQQKKNTKTFDLISYLVINLLLAVVSENVKYKNKKYMCM